jgi:hypothetical protein
MSNEQSSPNINDAIAAFGNDENKAALFIAMDPKVAYTQTSLHRRHVEIQGNDVRWKMATASPIHYAETFANVGQVVDETVGPGGFPAFQRNETGNSYVPLAGHLTHLSLTEEPPLLAYAGPTNTSSKQGVRPNQRRIQVMRLLRDSEGRPLRVSDIAENLDIVIDHAATITDAMNMYGIVDKAGTGRGKPSLRYSGTLELPTMTVRTDVGTPLFLEVVKVLQSAYCDDPNMSLTNEDIAQRLIATVYPDMAITPLVKKIAGISSRLAYKRGVLVAKREISDAATAREVVSADETQLRRIGKYVSIVDGAIANTDDYITTGKARAEEIMSRTDLVGKLIEKAKKNATGLKRLESAQGETTAVIAELLRTAEGPGSTRDIQKQLHEKGIILDYLTISNHVGTLRKLGKVSATTTRSGTEYAYAEPV